MNRRGSGGRAARPWALLAVVCMACGHGSRPGPLASDLSQLRWIEGTWRGTGDVEAPFYERYRFENESTLVEHGLDSTLTVGLDTSRFQLRDGRLGNARWRATALTADSVVFVSEVNPRRSFRWRRDGTDAWTAVISGPATSGVPAQRTYHMERWPK